jgi:hypothetical protein
MRAARMVRVAPQGNGTYVEPETGAKLAQVLDVPASTAATRKVLADDK